MRCLLSRNYFLRFILLISVLLLVTSLILAQDEPPTPQFLYRNENRLVMINGYTGEATELPFEVTERDSFAWSPDGQYLVAKFRHDSNYGCLNLYDVGLREWVFDKPLSCAVTVEDVIFSADTTQFVYSTIDKTNGALWLYNLETETLQELYRTAEGGNDYDVGISRIAWSPTGKYLTFVDYDWIMGGTLNSFIVMNMENQIYVTVNAPDTYYASYNPIWSTDENWFLIVLKEEYTTSGSVPHTNHEGDVYLVNSETGEQYRLTYTPALPERGVRWTEDGRIIFTIEQPLTFTLEEAMNVEEAPYESITIPEPYEPELFYYGLNGLTVSPDPKLSAWITETQVENSSTIYTLNFGTAKTGRANFSVPLQDYDYNQHGNVIIGWRPSDYNYSLP